MLDIPVQHRDACLTLLAAIDQDDHRLRLAQGTPCRPAAVDAPLLLPTALAVGTSACRLLLTCHVAGRARLCAAVCLCMAPAQAASSWQLQTHQMQTRLHRALLTGQMLGASCQDRCDGDPADTKTHTWILSDECYCMTDRCPYCGDMHGSMLSHCCTKCPPNESWLQMLAQQVSRLLVLGWQAPCKTAAPAHAWWTVPVTGCSCSCLSHPDSPHPLVPCVSSPGLLMLGHSPAAVVARDCVLQQLFLTAAGDSCYTCRTR